MKRSEILVLLTRAQEPFFTTQDETTALTVLDGLGPNVSMQKKGRVYAISLALDFISLVKLADDTSMGAFHEMNEIGDRRRRLEAEAQVIARTVIYLTGKVPSHDD